MGGAGSATDHLMRVRAMISRAFSPSAPIDQRELFAGRINEIDKVVEVISQRGQHAVIYGERGVGKTSLAAVMEALFPRLNDDIRCVRVNCDRTDDFNSIWRRVFRSIQVNQQINRVGFETEPADVTVNADMLFPPDNATPDDVKELLAKLDFTVIFLDEFDRLENTKDAALFADTIKILSDHSVPATIVLVGVADNVTDLIGQHQSVERALEQIRMPRMNKSELRDIINKRLPELGLTISEDSLDMIINLSQGLPHYIHLLGQRGSLSAALDSRTEIAANDVEIAIKEAIQRTSVSTHELYKRATSSSRDTYYGEVLLSCALADKDEYSSFAPADVREPYSKIIGAHRDIPAFVRHLKLFTEPERGPVLERMGVARRYRYRFSNPLLQPFVIMKGLSSGLIKGELLRNFTT